MATVVAGAEDRSVSIGRILSRAFGTIVHNPGVTLGIAFLLGALPSALISWLFTNIRGDVLPRLGLMTTLAVGFLSFLVAVLLAVIAQGALVRATVAESKGRVASMGESITAGLVVAIPLLLLAIISSVGVAIGFVLLVVPGVILLIMWCVAVPALVEEQRGVFDALRRSRALTSGARWKIFGLLLILGVILWIFSIVAGVLNVTLLGQPVNYAVAMQSGMPLGMFIIMAIQTTITSAIVYTTLPSLFVELRNWKDGPASEALAEVFA